MTKPKMAERIADLEGERASLKSRIARNGFASPALAVQVARVGRKLGKLRGKKNRCLT